MPCARDARKAMAHAQTRNEGRQCEIDEKIGQEAQAGTAEMPPELPKSATRRSAIRSGSPNQDKFPRMGLGKGPHGSAARQAFQRE